MTTLPYMKPYTVNLIFVANGLTRFGEISHKYQVKVMAHTVRDAKLLALQQELPRWAEALYSRDMTEFRKNKILLATSAICEHPHYKGMRRRRNEEPRLI